MPGRQRYAFLLFGIICFVSWNLLLDRIQFLDLSIQKKEDSIQKKRTISNEESWKSIKIHVYQLPKLYNDDQLVINEQTPSPIYDPHCKKNFYSAEYSFHQYLLTSSYRTRDANEADFFYVPVYAVCYLINNHPNNLTKTAEFIGGALSYIQNEYPYWNRSRGRDHVFAFTQGFGPRLFNWTTTKSSIFLVANGQFTQPEFTPHKDIPIPPDLSHYFTPLWILPNRTLYQEKKHLAFFGGSVLPSNLTDHRGSFYSKGVRQFITKHFKDHPSFRITGTRSPTYHEDIKFSTFCICPEGWHAWNPRPYEAVQLGCIPVLLSDELELAFEETIDYSKFLIRIHPTNVSRLLDILQSIPKSEIKARQEEMEKVWKYFSYHPTGGAPEMIVRHLAKRKPSRKIQREYLDVP